MEPRGSSGGAPTVSPQQVQSTTISSIKGDVFSLVQPLSVEENLGAAASVCLATPAPIDAVEVAKASKTIGSNDLNTETGCATVSATIAELFGKLALTNGSFSVSDASSTGKDCEGSPKHLNEYNRFIIREALSKPGCVYAIYLADNVPVNIVSTVSFSLSGEPTSLALGRVLPSTLPSTSFGTSYDAASFYTYGYGADNLANKYTLIDLGSTDLSTSNDLAFADGTCSLSASPHTLIRYVAPFTYTVRYNNRSYHEVPPVIALAAFACANPPGSVVLMVTPTGEVTFEGLPAELRDKVWTIAVENSINHVQVITFTDPNVPIGRWGSPARSAIMTSGLPSFMEVNRAAYGTGLSLYDACVGLGYYASSVMICFDYDVLYIAKELDGDYEDIFSRLFSWDNFAMIRRVVFEVTSWWALPKFLRLILELPSCVEVSFTHLSARKIAQKINGGLWRGTTGVHSVCPLQKWGILTWRKGNWVRWWRTVVLNQVYQQEVLVVYLEKGVTFPNLDNR